MLKTLPSQLRFVCLFGQLKWGFVIMNTREHFSNHKHLSCLSFPGWRVSWRSPRTRRRTGRRTVFGDFLAFCCFTILLHKRRFLHFSGFWKLSLQQQWRQPPRVDFLQAGGDRWWWWCTVMVMVDEWWSWWWWWQLQPGLPRTSFALPFFRGAPGGGCF